MAKEGDVVDDDKLKVMAESAELIAETNELRKELRRTQKQNKKMASVLGISTKYMLPKEAQKKLSDATDSKRAIHTMYADKIQVSTLLLISSYYNCQMKTLIHQIEKKSD